MCHWFSGWTTMRKETVLSYPIVTNDLVGRRIWFPFFNERYIHGYLVFRVCTSWKETKREREKRWRNARENEKKNRKKNSGNLIRRTSTFVLNTRIIKSLICESNWSLHTIFMWNNKFTQAKVYNYKFPIILVMLFFLFHRMYTSHVFV